MPPRRVTTPPQDAILPHIAPLAHPPLALGPLGAHNSDNIEVSLVRLVTALALVACSAAHAQLLVDEASTRAHLVDGKTAVSLALANPTFALRGLSGS